MISAERRIVGRPLAWVAAAAACAAVATGLVRGLDASVSILLAAGIVVLNAGLAAAASALAGRRSTSLAAMIAMPSFFIRMALIVSVLAALRPQPFIDPTSFAAAFGIAVVLVLVLEMRSWRRTPWLALTLEETP